MSDSERIAAIEQDLAQLRAELMKTIPRMQAKDYALSVFLIQTAAYLPAPDMLFQSLMEDVETSTLFSQMSDQGRERAVEEMHCIYQLLLSLRRGMAESELKRLPE